MIIRKFCGIVFIVIIIFSAPSVFADSAALLDEAIKDYESENLDTAKNKIGEILKAEPDNTIALYYMGVILYQQNKSKEAIPYLEKVARSSPSIEGIEALLAGVYLDAGKADKALEYYGKQYKANPEDEETVFHYASSLQGAGREDEAAEFFRQLIQEGGSYADTSRYQLGELLSDRGAYKSAIEQFKAIDPKSPYAEAAGSYIKSLSPFTRLLNFYGSTKFFYNDNPGSVSSDLVNVKQSETGSPGVTLVGLINTRGFELTDRTQAKMEYMFFGTFYFYDEAQNSNFIGHYINPALNYHLGSSIDLELKGDVQLLYFNQQHLSTNLGTTLTSTWTSKKNHSVNLHGAYLRSAYTDSYQSAGSTVSLEYQDAWTLSLGLGTTIFPKWGGNLTLDYNFNDEHTINEDDAVLGPDARDNRFREHVAQADIALPLPGMLSRLSILGNLNYSYKDYLNTQSGVSFPSAAGKNLTADVLTLGIKIQASLWKAINLKLIAGMEQANSSSIATELDYKRNLYFTQITARY